MTTEAITRYVEQEEVTISKSALMRAVHHFNRKGLYIEGLALIRAAYSSGGDLATLNDAKYIYLAITGEAPWMKLEQQGL